MFRGAASTATVNAGTPAADKNRPWRPGPAALTLRQIGVTPIP